jgi:ribosomal protein S18 acetylase RimI-like enzyme
MSLSYTIRTTTPVDEPFLWQMLYYAANMAEDGAQSGADAMTHPYLAKYVRGWGRTGDLGTIAVGDGAQPLGAAWVRLLIGAEKNYAVVADGVPELAVAVLPQYIGQGIGARLLAWLLDDARAIYPAVVLSVRAANPARRLYERMGFATVDTVVNRVDGKSFVMLKDLQGV